MQLIQIMISAVILTIGSFPNIFDELEASPTDLRAIMSI